MQASPPEASSGIPSEGECVLSLTGACSPGLAVPAKTTTARHECQQVGEIRRAAAISDPLPIVAVPKLSPPGDPELPPAFSFLGERCSRVGPRRTRGKENESVVPKARSRENVPRDRIPVNQATLPTQRAAPGVDA